MFFWVACAWCLAHVLVGPPPRRALGWWAAAGAMLGLGMLSKYAAVLLIAGAGLYVLTRREQRHWLAHPGPYLALAIALCVFAPVIVWNAQHRWVSFVFQSTRGVEDFSGIRPDWLLKNVAGQALAILPWLWAGLVVELVTGFGRRPPQPARQFVSWLSVPPIVLFTGVAAWSSTSQHHFHWAHARLPPPLPPARRDGAPRPRGGQPSLSRGTRGNRRRHADRDHRAHQPYRDRLAPGPARPVPRPHRHRGSHLRMRGHDGPRARVSTSAGSSTGRDVFVFSDWWFRAGKVDYGLKGRLPVLAFTSDDPRGFAFFDRSERYLGKDGILVTTKTAAEVTGAFGRYFERITPLGGVEVGRRGRAEYTLYLYRGERLRAPYPQPYG